MECKQIFQPLLGRKSSVPGVVGDALTWTWEEAADAVPEPVDNNLAAPAFLPSESTRRKSTRYSAVPRAYNFSLIDANDISPIPRH